MSFFLVLILLGVIGYQRFQITKERKIWELEEKSFRNLLARNALFQGEMQTKYISSLFDLTKDAK